MLFNCGLFNGSESLPEVYLFEAPDTATDAELVAIARWFFVVPDGGTVTEDMDTLVYACPNGVELCIAPN